MTDENHGLSRRRVLGSLGVIGGAAALGGAGTMAGFTDVEEKVGWLTAGELDLLLDYRSTYVPWERFELNPDDALRDGDYTNGEAIPVDGDDMTYVVGQAPDYRAFQDDGDLSDDPAVDGQTWAQLTTSFDPCPLPSNGNGATRTDIRDEFSDNNDVRVFGSPTVTDDTYEPGFVDGFTGMQVDLFDVKPLDHGESTISLHICGNPAFVEYDFNYEVDQATSDHDNGINEPEGAAGDTGTGVWANGELDDFLWVRLWDDPNCNNMLDETETVIYQGSLAGLLEQGPRQLNPFIVTGQQNGNGNSFTGLPIDTNEKLTTSGNPRCDNLDSLFLDENGEPVVDFEQFAFLDTEDVPTDPTASNTVVTVGDCEITIDWLDNGDGDVGGISYSVNDAGNCEICAVILKGGNSGASVYLAEDGDADSSSEIDVDVDYTGTRGEIASTGGDGKLWTPLNPSGFPAQISNMSFCVCEVVDGEIPPADTPLCLLDACIAYEWFLPQEVSDTSSDPFGVGGQGFADLPSGFNGDTLADEIVTKFELNNENQIDVNVVQTDSVHYTTEFTAEQCRHHLGGNSTA